jgi:hypothetical protein
MAIISNRDIWLDYVIHGMAITPLQSGTKRPNLSNWQDPKTAVKTRQMVDELCRFPVRLNGSAGLLLAHGDVPLMTLDIDDHIYANDWFAERGIELGDLFVDPDNVQIQSGVPNKAKLVFALDTPMVHTVIKNDGAVAIEFRCMNSTGGSLQDVLPPSIHPDTKRPYKWHGDWKNIPKLPQALVDIWQHQLDEKATPNQGRSDNTAIPDTTQFKDIARALDNVSCASLSRAEWVNAAMAIHSELPDDVGLTLFDNWSQTDPDRYDFDACATTWRSIKPGPIGIGTLFAMVSKSTTSVAWSDVDIPTLKTVDAVVKEVPTTITVAAELPGGFDEQVEDLCQSSLVVPGNYVNYITSGQTIFSTAQSLGKLYRKEREVFHLLPTSGRLERVDHKMLPSIVDEMAGETGKPVMGVYKGTHGTPVIRGGRLMRTEAEVLLASSTVDVLDEIRMVSPTPFITEDGSILHKGYHSSYQVLVTGGSVSDVEFDEAVEALDELLCDFAPFTPSDKSRMMASLITPAFKPAKMIVQSPLFFYSSDQSQAGKGLAAESAPCIYDCIAENVKRRDRGAGSFEENMDAALIAGRQFITLDNFKGDLNSGWLEGLITAGSNSHSARAAYSRQTVVDTTSCNWSLTSNGVRGTEDLVNRMAIIKLKKHKGDYQFRYGSKEGYHQHIQSNQSYYLGCVLAIIKRWIADGKPKGSTGGHSFIPWASTLDFIVTNYFGYPPLMEGMTEAKRSIADPIQAWVRLLCIAVAADDQLGVELSTSELVEVICSSSNGADDLPNGQNLGRGVEAQQSQALGRMMTKVKKVAMKNVKDYVSIDGYTLTWKDATYINGDYVGKPRPMYTVTMDGEKTTNEEACPF